MYLVRFSSTRVVDHTDPVAFERAVTRWLTLREAENAYLLGEIPHLMNGQRTPDVRMFTLEDAGNLVAAGALLPNGCLCMTWGTQEMAELLADHAAQNNWQIMRTCAPSHISLHFARAYVQKTGQRFGFAFAERVYQLEGGHVPQVPGRLELASEDEKPLVRKWLAAFVSELDLYEGDSPERMADELVDHGSLYLWKNPGPVAMAARTTTTPHGACINFVYTPPESRRRGYGKAVTAALASRLLADGLKYCFILTDARDARSNHVYQSIGGRTLCEILHYRIGETAIAVG